MRFLNLLAAAASLLLANRVAAQSSSAAAAPTQSAASSPGSMEPLAIATLPNSVTAGSSVTIKWNPSGASTVSFVLRYGPTNALLTGPSIGDNVPDTGSYTWQVSSNIPSGPYSIQITDSNGATNYSPFFQLSGGAASASGSSMSGSVSMTASGTSTSKSGSTTSTSTKTSTSTSSKSATATATATQNVPSGAAGRVGAGTGFAAVVGLGALVAIV